MKYKRQYYCTSCKNSQPLDDFHFCPKKLANIGVIDEDQKHMDVRYIGEDISIGDLMAQEIDMNGSGFDPATGKSRPWFKATAGDTYSTDKTLTVAWRDFKKDEELNKSFWYKKVEIPIADEDPTYHQLNTIRSNLLSIASLIETESFYRAHHETLMLEKYVREIQRSGSVEGTL